MSHILFDGDIRRHPALRSLLWQWGVTVSDLSSGARDGSQPTVEECDAVVRLGEKETAPARCSGAMPDGAEKEGAAVAEAAPLLFIGEGAAAERAWVSVPEPGPGGARLKAALQSCVERARSLRGDPVSRLERDRFRDFLGHELRTPLTAIQTALAILQSDPKLGSGPDRMLGIARRNLTRLADTVEWSLELGALEETSPAPDLASVEPGELADFLPAHLRPAYDPLDGSGTLFTDPLLLGTLVGQAERVLSYACPGCLPSFRLAFDPDSGQGVITAEAERPANRSPQVARTSGSAPGRENADWDQAEFRNLARLMISPQLLQALGIRVRVSTPSRDCFRLSCELPLVETPATAPLENMPVV